MISWGNGTKTSKKISSVKHLTEIYFDILFVQFLDKITNEKKTFFFLARGKQLLSNEI